MFVCPCNVHKRRAISSSGYYRCKKLIGEGRLALWVPPIEALPASEVEDENGDAELVEMKAIEFARWLLSARRVWTADSESSEFNEIKRKPKEDE